MSTANDLRQMTTEELGRNATELRETLFHLRLKLRTGQLEQTSEFGRVRRELARIATLQREMALGIVRAVHAGTHAAEGQSAAAKSEPKAKKKAAPKGKAKAAAKGKK
jgi:large subunit ribosomal protein L29